ncbi:hypothetical protein Bca52824_076441 [Brassica carinata]|uniref:Uncharacterized protein n=1 Tax=Brassica carinata TaxID=52824 RepID=A0A8X7TWN4_BRACI|nr:hypothetical protein Bca52824_076441 [Brassica carinata]
MMRYGHSFDVIIIQVKEAEMMSLSKQQKIELEAQLGEAEDIVGELRMELRESRYQLEKLTIKMVDD